MKRIILICCGIVTLFGGIWLYSWWHSPAETKTFTTSDLTTQDVLGSEMTLVSWSTAHFTTRYPTNLRIVTRNEIPHGITTGQYMLGSVSRKQTDQLAVTVGVLQNMPLSELPAVKLRQQHTDTYQPTSWTPLPAGGVAFRSTEEYETAVFWQHDDRYAAVVASGSSVREAELEQALRAVVTNWQWR